MAAALSGCSRVPLARNSGPLKQGGYLWQRAWTQPVADAFGQAQAQFDSVTILAGEIVWEGARPRLTKSTIRWDVVAQAKNPTTLALRVAPFSGPFASADANAGFITATAKSLLDEAASHGAKIAEFQLDFDCAQKKLAGYRDWLNALRVAIQPMPLSITALPSWLDEPEFNHLLGTVDDYVLQVHSVPARNPDDRATMCDPQRAKIAVEKAAHLGKRFTVALPTYRCLGGYAPDGKLLGVAMDSVQPSWPGGTRVLEFASDPVELAKLVADWQGDRPSEMNAIVWYRIPIESDLRNWRWPTLRAVMEGREPVHKLALERAGENPIDLELFNDGEAEERFAGSVTATWKSEILVASDAVAGWAVQANHGCAVFAPERDAALRLLPGERRAIGWLRYDRPAQLELLLAPTTR
ncbi:MAG: DUF3142 domain-containing protein [Verrucomicrobiota bacterium]|nr:DUF3142 domain-containing protein [Verrucomicrobiota bacterium]